MQHRNLIQVCACFVLDTCTYTVVIPEFHFLSYDTHLNSIHFDLFHLSIAILLLSGFSLSLPACSHRDFPL